MLRALVNISVCLFILLYSSHTDFFNSGNSTVNTLVSVSGEVQINKAPIDNPDQYPVSNNLVFEEETEETKHGFKYNVNALGHFISLFFVSNTSIIKLRAAKSDSRCSCSIPLFLRNSVFIV